MGSIAAKKVARELVANGGTVANAMRKAGYSPNTARTPKKVTSTKAYKEAMDPFIQSMITQRQRAIDALASRKLTKDKTRDLTDLIDKLTKNVQLLNGGKTSNEGIQIGWE